jgi:hypothetical protein
MSYWDTVSYLGAIGIYIIGLYIAYIRGKNSMKSKYSELINRLHKQYAAENSSRNRLLDILDDMEENFNR